MKNNHEFDKFLRSEINSINYDGADEAWESFANGVGEDVLLYTGKKNYISLTRYMSLVLALVGCIGLYAFVNFDDADLSILENQTINSVIEQNKTLVPLKRNIPQVIQNTKNNDVNGPVRGDVDESTKQIISHVKSEVKGINQIILQSDVTNHIISHAKQPPLALDVVSRTVEVESAKLSISPFVDEVSSDRSAILNNIDDLTLLPLLANAELNIKANPLSCKFGRVLIPIKKRPLRFFGELGISNNNAGIKLIAGISVPLAKTWDIELGAGVNSRIGDKDIFSLNFESESVPDYNEEHTYAFSQLINFMAPIRLKKKFKKHHILVGGQFIRNVTNEVELNSSMPYRSSATNDLTIETADVTYLYQNSRKAVNNYSVVSSTEWNFEMVGGYEYQHGRLGIGVQVSKSVAPSFKLFSKQNADLLYQVKSPLNFGVNLKYYI